MNYNAATYPRIKLFPDISISIADDETSGDYEFDQNYIDSESHSFEVTIPNWTNTVTATFSILSPSGATIYSISGLAQNATYYLLVSRPITNTTKLNITLSGVPGGSGGTVTIKPWLYR